MGLLEDRILRIIELRQKGLDGTAIAGEMELNQETIVGYETNIKASLEDIAKKGYSSLTRVSSRTGMSLAALKSISSFYNIELPDFRSKKKSSPPERRLEQIRKAIEDGAKDFKEISEIVGLTEHTVRNYSYGAKITLPKGISKVERRLEQIRKAIEDGAKDSKEISEIVGLTENTVKCYSYKAKITLPREISQFPNTKRVELRDRLIRKGYTLEEIGDATEVSRERVRQYINSTRQYALWRNRRRKRKRGGKNKEYERLRQQTLGEIVSQIDSTVLEKLPEDDKWAYEKALDYKNITRSGYLIDRLFELFKRYDKARNNGEKVSLNKLGEGLFGFASNTGRVLQRMELRSLCNNSSKKRVVTSKEKKETIRRSIKTPMGPSDLAYFIGVSYNVVHQNIRYWGLNEKKLKQANPLIKKELSYEIVSQIYESEDLDFSKRETLELLDISEIIYDFVMENKRSLSDDIKNALEILYPQQEIDKPYKNF